MFEEKVEIKVPEKNFVTKKFCGTEIKIHKFLEEEYVYVIAKNSCDRFMEEFSKTNDIHAAMISCFSYMNQAICYVSTNINIDNLSYDELKNSGIFELIKENLSNYYEIRDSVLSFINVIFSHAIVTKMNELPSLDELANTSENIKELFESNPEKAKEFAQIILANHPELNIDNLKS